MPNMSSADTYTYTVAANSALNVPVGCEFIHCVSASGPVYVKLREGSGRMYFVANSHYDGESEINGFDIVNESGAAITVQLLLGYGKYDLGGVSIVGTVDTKTHGGSNSNTGAVSVGTVATVIRASNTSRTSWTVHNNSSQTVFIGPAGVTVATGMPIAAGEKYGEDGTDAIYGIVAATTSDVRYREVY